MFSVPSLKIDRYGGFILRWQVQMTDGGWITPPGLVNEVVSP